MSTTLWNGKLQLVRKFLVSYIIILLVPLIVGLFNYNKTIQVLEAEVEISSMNLINQNKEMLDRRLSEVQMIAQQVTNNARVSELQFLKQPFEGSNVYGLLDTSKHLYNYGLLNNFITDFYLVYSNNDLAINSSEIYKLAELYSNKLNYEGISYNQWIEMIFGQFYVNHYMPEQAIIMRNSSNTYVTYIQSLGYANYSFGALMILIDAEELKKGFDWVDTKAGGWAYIADEEGNIITSVASSSADIVSPRIAREWESNRINIGG